MLQNQHDRSVIQAGVHSGSELQLASADDDLIKEGIVNNDQQVLIIVPSKPLQTW